jgi:hypothetical protein
MKASVKLEFAIYHLNGSSQILPWASWKFKNFLVSLTFRTMGNLLQSLRFPAFGFVLWQTDSLRKFRVLNLDNARIHSKPLITQR